MKTLSNKIILVLAMLALAVSACAPSSALAAQLTASPTSTTVPFSTPVPSDLTTATGIPTEAPTGSAPNTVTLDNNNKQITLHVGDSFLLKLGQEYDWSPVIDDQDVVSRIPNISVIVGAQGIYLAHKPGTATLTATGDAPCRQSKPPCMVPTLLFTLHIDVQP
jgi:hypothetical protein